MNAEKNKLSEESPVITVDVWFPGDSIYVITTVWQLIIDLTNTVTQLLNDGAGKKVSLGKRPKSSSFLGGWQSPPKPHGWEKQVGTISQTSSQTKSFFLITDYFSHLFVVITN